MSRLMGIEIEFIKNGANVNATELAQAINMAGVSCFAEGYNHNRSNHWKIVSDASVRNNQGNHGAELVSPPLTATEMKAQLEIVCRVLNQMGMSVNKTCGIHIHHDARDFDINVFKNLYAMYIRFETALDTLLPESRRADNNQYCRGFHNNQASLFNSIRQARNVNDILNLFGSRYMKLNIQSYQRHGTVEFRQHSGSIDFTKIWNWAVLTSSMIQTAMTSNVSIPKDISKMSEKWFDFKKVIKGYKWMGASDELQATIEFYNKRRQELAKELHLELTA